MAKKVLIVGMALLVLLAIGISGSPQGQGGMVASDVVVKLRPSYAEDIQPIFDEFCVLCHGPEDAHNGLRLDSYEGLMRGTQYGPVVYPGEPDLSNLLVLIKHESSPEIWMPFHREQLTPGRIKNIENWVRQGAESN